MTNIYNAKAKKRSIERNPSASTTCSGPWQSQERWQVPEGQRQKFGETQAAQLPST